MIYLQRKKLAFMSIANRIKGFVRTVSSIPPLILPDCVDNNSIINYTIDGNSVQNGTPTPENPVEVESVGEYDEETGKYKIPVVCNNGKGDSVITNIYLDEPLRKFYNYKDYIDFENQKVVRKIKSEHITKVDGTSANLTNYRVYLSNISKKPLITESVKNIVVLTNKFKQPTSTIYYGNLSVYPNSCLTYITSGGVNRIAYTFGDKDISTVEQGQEALGDGFKINYAMVEEEETPITLPKLPTFNGTTIYTIGTSIQPTNMSATYYATSKE